MLIYRRVLVVHLCCIVFGPISFLSFFGLLYWHIPYTFVLLWPNFISTGSAQNWPCGWRSIESLQDIARIRGNFWNTNMLLWLFTASNQLDYHWIIIFHRSGHSRRVNPPLTQPRKDSDESSSDFPSLELLAGLQRAWNSAVLVSSI